MKYLENYYNLSHGTDMISAQSICQNGFKIKGDGSSWCGKGVYFYDIKSKAWWAANRKCEEIKKATGDKVKPNVVFADIKNIDRKEIFDLRVKRDLDLFEEFVDNYLDGTTRINIDKVEDETERKIILRAMLISFLWIKRKGSW